jgi:competence CoiA-like predicted nuclease
MTALPRGRCPVCGADVALRKGGKVREHYVYRAQADQDLTVPMGRMRVCEGSGKVPA